MPSWGTFFAQDGIDWATKRYNFGCQNWTTYHRNKKSDFASEDSLNLPFSTIFGE